MKKEEFLAQIDHDSYVLKNKLMAAFDQNFGTELGKKDADSLHFCDIMVAVYEKRPGIDDTMIYPVLKRAVGHGVTDAQKNFLYEYTKVGLKNEPGEDVEDYVKCLRDNFAEAPEGASIVAVKIGINDDAGLYALSIFQCPMVFAEFLRLVPKGEKPIEAILVQNGGVMIIRTTDDRKEMRRVPFEDALNNGGLNRYSGYIEEDD